MKKSIKQYTKHIESTAKNAVATRRSVQTMNKAMSALPNPDPILKKLGKRVETYRNLTGDWEVFAALELLHGGLQNLKWELEQGDSESKLFEPFEERFQTWNVRQILSECVQARGFGYQPFEILWAKQKDAWLVTGITGKPPEWFNFSQQNELQLKTTANRMGEVVQPYQFAVATHRATYDNPYGEAVYSRLFWPVTFKKGGVEFWTTFLEKYGIPWVVGKQPRGTKEKETNILLDSLENMIQDAVAVIPDDSSVDIMESSSKGGSNDVFKAFSWYWDAAINKVLLSSETTMSVSKEGSDVRGDSRSGHAVSKSVIHAIGKMAEQVINEAIRWEWHFNHEGPPPAFRIYEPKQVQKERSDRDNNLKTQGVAFNKEYYVNNYGLNPDEFDLQENSVEDNKPEFKQQKSPLGRGQMNPRPEDLSGVGFAEGDQLASQNQRIIDQMIDYAGGEDSAATNQRMMEATLKPVIEMIENAGSMEDIMQHLAEQLPEMSTKQLEQRLESALFLADTWGRSSAAEEDD